MYIAILRGINVSGHKMIKMDALREMFGKLKFKKVRTYIQSGNVIFDSRIGNTKEQEKRIANEIKQTFGFDVPVIVKELGEWKDIVSKNPFINKRKEDTAKLHVTFLSEEPESVHLSKMKEVKFEHDEFILSEKAIYLFCPNGYGNTKLNNTFFENKLKVNATTRNWKTVNELMNMAETL
jgi:uncharacterized protein (DUF1697 family)